MSIFLYIYVYRPAAGMFYLNFQLSTFITSMQYGKLYGFGQCTSSIIAQLPQHVHQFEYLNIHIQSHRTQSANCNKITV